MKTFFRILILVGLLLACFGLFNKYLLGADDPIPFCGFPSKIACHCTTRVEKIQTKAAAVCNGPDWKNSFKSIADCFQATLQHLQQCDIAELWISAYDGEDYEGQSGESEMGPMCSMACKKHDCKCAHNQIDQVCHFGHTAADHNPPVKK